MSRTLYAPCAACGVGEVADLATHALYHARIGDVVPSVAADVTTVDPVTRKPVKATRPAGEAEAVAALGVTAEQVRAAAARIEQITEQAATLDGLPPLNPTTNAAALAAIRTLDTRQRLIAAGLADVAAIVRAMGKVALREIT